jgi:hypothetical protein
MLLEGRIETTNLKDSFAMLVSPARHGPGRAIWREKHRLLDQRLLLNKLSGR